MLALSPPFGSIYMITSPSGRAYIGQTTKPISERMAWHQRHPGCRAIHAAIKKYGIAAMKVETLLERIPRDQLNWYEDFCVALFSTTAPSGYNLASGGNARLRTSPVTRARISAALRKYWTDQDARERRGRQMSLYLSEPAVRVRRSEISRLLRARPEDKTAASARMRVFWADPDRRAARAATMRGAKARKRAVNA